MAHVRLDPRVQVDLRELVRCAHRVLESTDLATREELASLIRAGELLPDWYDDWLVVERERARQLESFEARCRWIWARSWAVEGHRGVTTTGP